MSAAEHAGSLELGGTMQDASAFVARGTMIALDTPRDFAHTHHPPSRVPRRARTPMPPPHTDQARWFAEEVQAHEGQLRSYLRGAYPAVRDVDDVVQESYLRTWRARLARPIASTKSFLFRVARNLAIDALRHKQTAATESTAEMDELCAADEGNDAAVALGRQEKIELLTAALATLPERTREIVFLRKFEGLPQKDVAARLGIAERTVEARLAKGMKGCAAYLRKRGVNGFSCDE